MTARETYDFKIANHICPRCNGANDSDRVYCKACRDKEKNDRMIVKAMREAMGVCTKCGKNDADDGSKLCKECAEKVNSRNKADREYYRSINICPVCHKRTLIGEEKSCLECRARIANHMAEKRKTETAEDKKHNNEMRKLLRKKWESQGICTKCGSRPVVKGLKCCQVCRNKRHEYYERGRFEREEAKRIKRESGTCYFCDKPVVKGLKVCAEHHEKLIKGAHSEKAIAYRRKLGDKYYRLNSMKKAVNK